MYFKTISTLKQLTELFPDLLMTYNNLLSVQMFKILLQRPGAIKYTHFFFKSETYLKH